jgi:glucuronate isomerase
MLANFQSCETAYKIQFDSAWWMNDHIDGMQRQKTDLANLGVLTNLTIW